MARRLAREGHRSTSRVPGRRQGHSDVCFRRREGVDPRVAVRAQLVAALRTTDHPRRLPALLAQAPAKTRLRVQYRQFCNVPKAHRAAHLGSCLLRLGRCTVLAARLPQQLPVPQLHRLAFTCCPGCLPQGLRTHLHVVLLSYRDQALATEAVTTLRLERRLQGPAAEVAVTLF